MEIAILIIGTMIVIALAWPAERGDMMDGLIQERQGTGRRTVDQECQEHGKRLKEIETDLQEMDGELHKQSGWFKASAIIFTIAGGVLMWMGTSITTKLDTISTLLSDNKAHFERHDQQIIQLQTEVREIQERHRWLDQNGVVKRAK